MEETTKSLDSFEITLPTDNVIESKTFLNRVKNIVETIGTGESGSLPCLSSPID